MGKTYDKWKELEMKIKVIAMIVALFSSLGFGGSLNFAWSMMQTIQKNDARHDANDIILEENYTFLYYTTKSTELKIKIKTRNDELLEMRKRYGGPNESSSLPRGDDWIRAKYSTILEELKGDKEELEKAKIKIKFLEEKQRNKEIQKGAEK